MVTESTSYTVGFKSFGRILGCTQNINAGSFPLAPPDTQTVRNPAQLHVAHVKTAEKEQRESGIMEICGLRNVSFKMHYQTIKFFS